MDEYKLNLEFFETVLVRNCLINSIQFNEDFIKEYKDDDFMNRTNAIKNAKYEIKRCNDILSKIYELDSSLYKPTKKD